MPLAQTRDPDAEHLHRPDALLRPLDHGRQQVHREREQRAGVALGAARRRRPRSLRLGESHLATRKVASHRLRPGRSEVESDGDLRGHGVSSPDPRSSRATGTWSVAAASSGSWIPPEQPRRSCPADGGAVVIDDGDGGIERVRHGEIAESDEGDVRPPLAVHCGDDAQRASRGGWAYSAYLQ